MSGENPTVLTLRYRPDLFSDMFDYAKPPRLIEFPLGPLYVYTVGKGNDYLPHGTHYGRVVSVVSKEPLEVKVSSSNLGIEEIPYETEVKKWLRKQGYNGPFRRIRLEDQASTETVLPENNDDNRILEFIRRNNPFHRDCTVTVIYNELDQEGAPMKVMKIRSVLKRLLGSGKIRRRRGPRNLGLYNLPEEIDLVESYH